MKIKLMLVGCAFLLLNCSVAFAELDPLTPYDDFNDKKYNGCKYCINPEKWMGLQRGDYVTDLQRVIKAKRARLSHRSWGRADSDQYSEQARNRMVFRNSDNMSGACFVPRIKKYDLQDCVANGNSSRVRIRYVGKLYDANIGDPVDPGQEDGVIYAAIELGRYADSAEKKSIFEVTAWAFECSGADCTDAEPWNTYDDPDNDPDLYFGTLNASKNKKELCVGYDRVEHQLVFSFGNDVRIVDENHGLPAFVADIPSGQPWHVIEARTDVENCSDGAISAFIDADFDKVQIREYNPVP